MEVLVRNEWKNVHKVLIKNFLNSKHGSSGFWTEKCWIIFDCAIVNVAFFVLNVLYAVFLDI